MTIHVSRRLCHHTRHTVTPQGPEQCPIAPPPSGGDHSSAFCHPWARLSVPALRIHGIVQCVLLGLAAWGQCKVCADHPHGRICQQFVFVKLLCTIPSCDCEQRSTDACCNVKEPRRRHAKSRAATRDQVVHDPIRRGSPEQAGLYPTGSTFWLPEAGVGWPRSDCRVQGFFLGS